MKTLDVLNAGLVRQINDKHNRPLRKSRR